MTRCWISVVALAISAAVLMADDAPKPPRRMAHLQVILASGARAEGKEVQLRLLAPAFRMVNPDDGPEDDGRKKGPPRQAIVQEGWKEVTVTVDGKQVVVLDARGKVVDQKTLLDRLQGRTPVLLSLHGRPEAFDLQTTKEDTLIVVLSMDRLLAAQGGPQGGEALPLGRSGPGKFLEVGKTYKFHYGPKDEPVEGEVVEPACSGWVKIRYQKLHEIEGWINLAGVREIRPVERSRAKEGKR